MADIDVLDRLSRLERMVIVLMAVVRAGSNKEGVLALDAVVLPGPRSEGLTEPVKQAAPASKAA
jgi:hypothetical protein